MVAFLRIWSQYQSSFSHLAHQAYRRSIQKGAFGHEDFLQEAAICVLKCVDHYGEECPQALIYKVVKNHFGTLLHAQYLQARAVASYVSSIESFSPSSLTPFILLSQKLSLLAQQILWLLVDPPDELWERAALQETAKISRRIIAEYLDVAPQRVSEAVSELKEALHHAERSNERRK